MTGNDALAAYGQYHKALALAFAGDFVGAEAILAGGRGRAAAPQPRGDRRPRRDPRPDRPRGRRDRADRRRAGRRRSRTRRCIDLRDAARGRRGGALRPGHPGPGRRRRGVPDPRRRAQHRRIRSGVALVHARLAAHIRPDLDRGATCSPPRSSRREEQFALATEALADVSAETSPWYVTAQIRRAEHPARRRRPRRRHRHADRARRRPRRPDRGAESALGDALRMAERFPEAVGGLRRGDRAGRDAAAGALGALLHPRHRQRARRRLGRPPRPTSARRWSCSPTSRWC